MIATKFQKSHINTKLIIVTIENLLLLCMLMLLFSRMQCAAHLNLGHVIRVMNPSSKSTTTTFSTSLSTSTVAAISTTISTLDTTSTISTDPDVSGGFSIGTMFCYNTVYFYEREGLDPPPPKQR